MPFSGSGSFSVYTPGNPAVTGTTISSTSFNNTMNDFATGLTNTITRDGQSPATSNIPLGNNKITGLANGTARTDAAPVGQVQDGGFAYLSGVAGTNTITASLSPAITAYVAGQTFRFAAAGANTGAVTINVNGLGAKAVTKNGTSALITGDILANAVYSVTYDGTQFQISGALFSGGSFAASGANNDITSLLALAAVPSVISSNVVNLTGNQTVAGTKTFSSQPNFPAQSMVRLTTTGIANGSTNTVIARFSTQEVNQGSDITYADSLTLGALFTINTNGVYAISFTGGANCKFGISLNATGSPITTGIATISAATRLSEAVASAAGYYSNSAWTGYLPSGSLIRAHTDVAAMGANASFTIVRVA